MTIEHVEHVYETAKERLLFTLNIDYEFPGAEILAIFTKMS